VREIAERYGRAFALPDAARDRERLLGQRNRAGEVSPPKGDITHRVDRHRGQGSIA
jgi:hypothetical protein